jgi:hypothetical protein
MMQLPEALAEDGLEPAARSVARAGYDVLERVLLDLPRLPARGDRLALIAMLTQVLETLGLFSQKQIGEANYIDSLHQALDTLDRARLALSTMELAGDAARPSQSVAEVREALAATLESTIEQIIQQQHVLLMHHAGASVSSGSARQTGAAPMEKPVLVPFKASLGTPRLVGLARPPIPLALLAVPALVATETDDAPEDAEVAGREDAAENISIEALDHEESDIDETESSLEREILAMSDLEADLLPAEAELRGLERLARDVIEEIGTLGLLRAPDGASGSWGMGPETFEDRLLKNLDALVVLGMPFASANGEGRFDVLSQLLTQTGDCIVPDPARAFARAFVLGCFAGDDTARSAVFSLRWSHPITYEAQCDALALAPHPGIAPLLAKLCIDGPPRLVCVALDVLRRRREASFDVAAPLLSHPDAAVRVAAARCLSVVMPAEAALRLLEDHAHVEEDEAALAATAEALVILGSRQGLRVAREQLEDGLVLTEAFPAAARLDLLRLLGIAGGREDGELLLRALGNDLHAARTIGWHGDAGNVPVLLAMLESSAGLTSRVALAHALHRITGLGCPADHDGEEQIFAVEPSLDPAYWQRRWQEHKDKFTEPRKYRFGRPFSPVWTIAEAGASESSILTRQEVLLELSILSQGASQVEARDWVARQRTNIADQKVHLRQARVYPEGQWPSTARGMALNR